ncbi:MAG: electron transfer flavoprotein subunit beta/FixA family protein [Agromyces sp.]
MRIIALAKPVPDTYGDRELDLATGLADRGAGDTVIDEVGERAVEAAVTVAAAHEGTEIVVLSCAPDMAEAHIRKVLAIGPDRAVHVADPGLAGADLGLTAETLAAAVREIGFDLVVAGNVSTDGRGGMIPAMLAELLGVPHLTALSAWQLDGTTVCGSRSDDGSTIELSAELPAVVSVTEAFPEARFPNFKAIMAAKKKPFETWDLARLGVSSAPTSPRSIMLAVSEKPARAAGVRITDEGEAGGLLADFLFENRLV